MFRYLLRQVRRMHRCLAIRNWAHWVEGYLSRLEAADVFSGSVALGRSNSKQLHFLLTSPTDHNQM